MKKIIRSIVTFLIAVVGAIGGLIWAIFFNGGAESIILTIVSTLEIFGYFFYSDEVEQPTPISNTKQEQKVNVTVNVGETKKNIEKPNKPTEPTNIDRNLIVNSMKSKSKILFIDDDKKFNIVKILKDSGWKNTKTVVDVKSIDVPVINEADIIFVDINGVGKLLSLPHQGLDLALMIKDKYSTKKVGIYSANPNSNSFHKAWDIIDFKLEKNALPLQFQSIVEKYSIDLYNN